MKFKESTWRTGTFKTHKDERGSLTPVNLTVFNRKIRNIFWISDVTQGATRAGHGHKKSHQLLIVMCGEVNLEIITPTQVHHSISLVTANWAYIPPGHIITLKNFGLRTLIGVIASEKYNPDDLFV